MSNRNFDSRVIIQRLQNQNYARNLYQTNLNGKTLLTNPQNSDGTSSRLTTFVAGAQTDYFRGLIGSGESTSVGGIFGVSAPAPPVVDFTGSMLFDSTIEPSGSHVSYPNDSALAIGTNSFTIEWYQYYTRVEPFLRLFSMGTYPTASIAVSYEGSGFIFWKNGVRYYITTQPLLNIWTHIAIVGTSGTDIRFYQNGIETVAQEIVGAYDFTDSTTPLMIGNEYPALHKNINFHGNISNFRWVVGQALYNSTFTPPNIPLANISGTQLLLGVSGVVTDASSANRTPTNTGVIYSPLLPPMPFAIPPTRPTITTIIPGYTILTVAFNPPSYDGGAPILRYEYSTDNGLTFLALTPDSLTSPIIITMLSDGSNAPLVNDTQYSIRLRAVNRIGAGINSLRVFGTPSSIRIDSFTTVGSTTWTAPIGVTSVEYIVVGGGGGGGGGYDTGGGGGGGGGMVLSGTTAVTSGTVYTVIVGAAGDASTNNYPSLNETAGGGGGSSSFDTIISLGGEGGKGSRTQTGSSGMGGAAQTLLASAVGGSGGGSYNAVLLRGSGGGGGGAVAAGTNGSLGAGGIGGEGISLSLSGSSIMYGSGGNGARGNVATVGANGTSNRGNGGGGGGFSSSGARNGGAGGSGIVIIRY